MRIASRAPSVRPSAPVTADSSAAGTPVTTTAPPTQAPLPSVASFAQRAPPAPGGARLMDVRLKVVAAAAADPTDGVAFAQRALAEMKLRSSRGEKVRVVFDIDNTLFDTRAHTLEVAHAWDAAHGTHFFDGVKLDQVGRDGAETAARAGLPADVATRFQEAWNQGFWDGANLAHDLPIAPLVELARRAQAAGADVVYLTGRDTTLQPASLAQLVRAGLPDADAAHLFCKPPGTRTAQFKADTLASWMGEGMHLGFFVTEGRRDISFVQKAQPDVPCLLLDCSLERSGEGVQSSTPVYPAVF